MRYKPVSTLRLRLRLSAVQHGASRLLSTLRALKALACQHFGFSHSGFALPRTTKQCVGK